MGCGEVEGDFGEGRRGEVDEFGGGLVGVGGAICQLLSGVFWGGWIEVRG